MCGIVGVYGDIKTIDKQIFRDMWTLSIVRGVHSSGYVRTDIEHKTTGFRGLGPPSVLYGDNELDKGGIVKGKVRSLIGHNRQATIGDITIKNAHPFVIQNIAGVHNGTLRNWDDIKVSDSDSYSLLSSIQKDGLKATVNKISGAAAIVWFDVQDNLLNIYRNHERPMHFAMNKDKTVLYYASEALFIEKITEAYGVELDLKAGARAVPPAQHFRISMSEEGQVKEEREHVPFYQAVAKTSGIVGTAGKHIGGTGATNGGNIGNRHGKAMGGIKGGPVRQYQVMRGGRKKREEMINSNWAVGLPKAPHLRDKEIGLFTFHEKDDYFSGWFRDKDVQMGIRCIPTKPSHREMALGWLRSKGNTVLKLRAKPRIQKIGNIEFAKINLAHVQPLHFVNPNHYRGPDPNTYYSFKQIKDALGKTTNPGCCTGCGTPFDIEDFQVGMDLHMWLDDNTVLCDVCAEDEQIYDFVLNTNLKGL